MMKNFFTPDFLKFLNRFILILVAGIVGALIVGNINENKEENIKAGSFKVENEE